MVGGLAGSFNMKWPSSRNGICWKKKKRNRYNYWTDFKQSSFQFKNYTKDNL